MSGLTYTLLTEGTTDRCLMPLIDAALEAHVEAHDPASLTFAGRWADPAGFLNKPNGLAGRLTEAVRAYPCDLLLVHRDADLAGREKRLAEIREAGDAAGVAPVPVVPVRVTEAWLLCDEAALRRAAGNPNGTVPLDLPGDPERLPDPKRVLADLLTRASEFNGRRRKQFQKSIPTRVRQAAEFLPGLEPLRRLDAFRRFEADLRAALDALP